MQSLLSTIHHSLSATRAAFALRVFVSYDASGRRKDSLVVDIEQPRPPAHHTPRYTIRLLSPIVSPAAVTHTTHSTLTASHSTPSPLSSSSSSSTSLPSSSVPVSLPPAFRAPLSHASPALPFFFPPLALTRPSTASASSPPPHVFGRPPAHLPTACSPPPFTFSSSLPPASMAGGSTPAKSGSTGAAVETSLMPSPPPHLTQPATAATTTLPLAPCGVPDAVDAEMSGVSGGTADVWDAEVGPAPTSSSGPTPTSSSRWDSNDTVAHAQSQSSAESAALGKRRLKAKEKKRRQKARRSAEATRAQRGKGKEEVADDAGQNASSQISPDYAPLQWQPEPRWDGRSEGSEEMEESEVSDRSEWDAEIGCESPPRRAWGYM